MERMPPPTDPKHSLMDDAEFLAELEKLERVVPRERTAEPTFNAGLHELDEGLVTKAARDGRRQPSANPTFDPGLQDLDEGLQSGSIDDVPGDDWSQPPVFTEEEVLTASGPSAVSIALAVGGFLAMMALGAGVAAYVFRDRVALILSLAGR